MIYGNKAFALSDYTLFSSDKLNCKHKLFLFLVVTDN